MTTDESPIKIVDLGIHAPPPVRPGRLDRMAVPAERLPVRFVPEQPVVSLVRDDVVDDRRDAGAAYLEAHDAERVRGEEALPRRAPPRAVAPGRSRRPGELEFSRVPLAAALAPLYQGGAAGVAAGSLRGERGHAAFLFASIAARLRSTVRILDASFSRDFPLSMTYPGRRRSCR
jgi:hypothetical protein